MTIRMVVNTRVMLLLVLRTLVLLIIAANLSLGLAVFGQFLHQTFQSQCQSQKMG